MIGGDCYFSCDWVREVLDEAIRGNSSKTDLQQLGVLAITVIIDSRET